VPIGTGVREAIARGAPTEHLAGQVWHRSIGCPRAKMASFVKLLLERVERQAKAKARETPVNWNKSEDDRLE
jgi:hypothetical protein